MPANLTPQYHAAEEIFKKASTTEEKIAALEEMLAVIPKHKGTEKLQADIKKRLAKLREESMRKGAAKRVDPFHIERQEAGQVVLFGFPNTGKSSLLNALTRASAKVAEYPFTTTLPVSGMMPFEDILIQMVDLPPINAEMSPPGISGALIGADIILVVFDAGKDPDMKAPFVIRQGSTVLELAQKIHKDLASKLKFARVWGSARFEGQSVPKDYVLQDRDIVEINV